jgi:ribosomal protein S18 acetylase RimI-like enzyme
VELSIERCTRASDELHEAMDQLIPQLSSSWRGISRDDLVTLVANPNCAVFVARVDGSIIGTLTLAVVSIPTGRRAWIEDVVVDETARGIGAAKALVSAAIEEARHRDVSTVDLTSRPSRVAANQLYVSMGFVARDTNVYRFLLEG